MDFQTDIQTANIRCLHQRNNPAYAEQERYYTKESNGIDRRENQKWKRI